MQLYIHSESCYLLGEVVCMCGKAIAMEALDTL